MPKFKLTRDKSGLIVWSDIPLEQHDGDYFDPACRERGGETLYDLTDILLDRDMEIGEVIEVEYNIKKGGIINA
jgi:hypothetical protein